MSLDLASVLPGEVWDSSLLARVWPGQAPAPYLPVQPGIQIIEGVAYISVPGEKGDPGEVSGTIPWEQVIGRPLIGAYTFTQATAAAVWTVNHNLDTPPVHISVQDLTGSGLDGYGVQHVTRFQTRLTFSPPVAGMARFS